MCLPPNPLTPVLPQTPSPNPTQPTAGFTVVLVLAIEHMRLSRLALKMARLFVHNIVDRLHIVVVVQDQSDSKDKARLVRGFGGLPSGLTCAAVFKLGGCNNRTPSTRHPTVHRLVH